MIFEIDRKGKFKHWITLEYRRKEFKCEWATVKDGYLFVGSTGREWTNEKTGEIRDYNNMLVFRIDENGNYQITDETRAYNQTRKMLNFSFPGYIIHEAIVWSDIHKKWFMLPRYCTNKKYDKKNEKDTGCNLLISANPSFDSFEIKHVGLHGKVRDAQGFSSFKFIPGSDDTLIFALKTTETKNVANTIAMVFDICGNKISDSKTISEKYEGVEFLKNSLRLRRDHGNL